MNARYINPFIESSINVISQATGIQPTLGEAYQKTEPYGISSVNVSIGLIGRIQGSVIMSFDVEAACSVASAMMGGYPVSGLDKITKSAISELMNMIMGNAAIILSKENIDIAITTPEVYEGEYSRTCHVESEIICVPLYLNREIVLNLDISYKVNGRI